MIQVEQIDPLAGNAWDVRVTSRDDHSVFHLSAWARVLSETYGHRPYYLRILADGNDVALLPLMEVKSRFTGCRVVSLPFSDFAGPLWIRPEFAPDVHPALCDFVASKNWEHLDLRGGGLVPDEAPVFQTYDSHQLDLLPGLVALEQGVCPSVRRAIRKAENSGLQVCVETGKEIVSSFYDLHSRTRRRHGLPPQPVSFFDSIRRQLFDAGLGFVVIARLGPTPIAGAVFFQSGGNAVYKFGASDSEHWSLRPNQLVMWTAIRHLVKSGCRSLHFGRTSRGDAGLARFKLSWGCSSDPLNYFRYSPGKRAWLTASSPKAESHPLIFGHLPIALNQLAGRLIYPHLD